jgi:hypothetical protein
LCLKSEKERKINFILSLPLAGLCELLGGLLGYLATVTGVRQPYWEQAAGLGDLPMAQMRRRPFMADLSILDQVRHFLIRVYRRRCVELGG